MMQHSVVPQAFNNGIIISILKDKRGNATDINNYRAITLSPSISVHFVLLCGASQQMYEKILIIKSSISDY